MRSGYWRSFQPAVENPGRSADRLLTFRFRGRCPGEPVSRESAPCLAANRVADPGRRTCDLRWILVGHLLL